MDPTTGQAAFLLVREDDNHDNTITIDHPIAMDPRPVLMLQMIHTAAATIHLMLMTASGPQTIMGQMTMVLAATTIHMAATAGRRILAALMGHQT